MIFLVKIISFEGSIGVGKTTLTNYFSKELGIKKILEKYEINPFLKEFYNGDSTINFETEITFILIHYSQLKNILKSSHESLFLADFSIEKDLIYAELNLEGEELIIFKNLYNYIINKVGVPYMVIYLNLSFKKLKQRILKRGREFEMNTDFNYFKELNEKMKNFYKSRTKSKIWFINIDKLDFNPNNTILKQIRSKITNEIQ